MHHHGTFSEIYSDGELLLCYEAAGLYITHTQETGLQTDRHFTPSAAALSVDIQTRTFLLFFSHLQFLSLTVLDVPKSVFALPHPPNFSRLVEDRKGRRSSARVDLSSQIRTPTLSKR
jgi:hypothetical protein